jgi:hypothetical protein
MSYTYDQARDSEQLRLLIPAVDDFINRYKNPPASSSPCQRQTVFFFPGGMASRLVRARQPYQEGVGVPANLGYDDVWIAWDTLLGGWRKLKMHRDGTGCFRDDADRIIVASGAVSFSGVTPHDAFINWCAANKADLFVFGWDWRRRLDETVAFFLGRFLPFFRARVLAAGCPDPLANYSLVGHSFGGMIANLILRSDDPIVANMARAVTVATPFYGYASQLHRWFEGEPLLLEAELEALEALHLDFLADAARQDMLEVISSLPGLYTLHFLDEVTYAASQAGLGTDPDFPLASYPSMDATAAGLRADAYNPQTNGSLVRYPGNTGFDLSELTYARLQFQQLTAPMSAQLSQKFYNIRGVTTNADGQTPRTHTVGGVTWSWISPNFDPAGPSPISDSAQVPGDDTQPAWSARLLTNAAARCISVKGFLIEHACMMNHPDVVREIAAILCAAPATVAPPPPPQGQADTASESEVRDFLRWLYKHRRQRKKWPPLDRKIPPDFLPAGLAKRLPAIARRIFRDLVRGPVSPKKRKPKPGPGEGKPPRRRRPRRPARKG